MCIPPPGHIYFDGIKPVAGLLRDFFLYRFDYIFRQTFRLPFQKKKKKINTKISVRVSIYTSRYAIFGIWYFDRLPFDGYLRNIRYAMFVGIIQLRRPGEGAGVYKNFTTTEKLRSNVVEHL